MSLRRGCQGMASKVDQKNGKSVGVDRQGIESARTKEIGEAAMPTLFVKIALEIRQICVMLSVFTTLVSLHIYTNYEQDKFPCLRLVLIVYLCYHHQFIYLTFIYH